MYAASRFSWYSLVAVMLMVLSIPGTLVCAQSPTPGEHAAWTDDLRREAIERGIAPATVDAALDGWQPIERVIELDRSQPEFTLTFSEYLDRVVPTSRVQRGRQLLAEYRNLLDVVARRYGVQPRFVVALWGVESDFGRRTGDFPVIGALATLAYDGRRSAYFRRELLDALQILDDGHISVDRMRGSWAGAMGQLQFMPSSFRRFAVDYDGDGRRDIWDSTADALASAANYLARSGWRDDQTWGREVRLPKGFAADLVGRDVVKPLSEWQALGVRRADGGALPRRDLLASVVQPGGSDGPAFVVYEDYRVLLKWNRSDYFATAVGLLSDRIAGRG